MTLDILICSLNKGIVRVQDVLLEPQEGVRYIVSYQYTDERYLDLIPKSLSERPDVSVFRYKGQGLSANRNLALDKSTADIIMYADDDAHILPDTPRLVTEHFEKTLHSMLLSFVQQPIRVNHSRTILRMNLPCA